MANTTGSQILERENTSENITKLSAQREIYSRAKTLMGWQIILTVPIIIMLSIAKIAISYYLSTLPVINPPINPPINPFWKFDMEVFISTYALFLFFFDSLFLTNYFKESKEKAAGIQELFDCAVLEIEWNKMLFAEKPEPSIILKYHNLRKKRNKNDNFSNWYEEPIKEIDNNIAKLICQRENIRYDNEVREKLKWWGWFIPVVTLSVLIFLGIFSTNPLGLFIVNVITPFLPIFALSIKWYIEQNNAIKTIKEIKTIIQTLWDNVLEKGEIPSDATIRQIQDRIHLHRREGGLVPDFIYNRIRTEQEEQMFFSIEHSVEEYRKKFLTAN
jgi:hypothetical protein